MIGNYYLYALPDTNNSNNAAPCYYANDLRWQNAYLLPVDADVYDVDIQLQLTDFVLPVGEASISGHMEKPMTQNLIVKSTVHHGSKIVRMIFVVMDYQIILCYCLTIPQQNCLTTH